MFVCTCRQNYLVLFLCHVLGGINSIRSNSNWMSELLNQLSDHMRNFIDGQNKMSAKYEILLEKVF